MEDLTKSGVVPIKTAAAILGVDAQTLRLMLQHQQVDFGMAYKRPGSKQYGYMVFAKPFYEKTGYRCKSDRREVPE